MSRSDRLYACCPALPSIATSKLTVNSVQNALYVLSVPLLTAKIGYLRPS